MASGSSYHCARFAVDLVEKISKIETRAIYSSEFLLKNLIPKDENTLYGFHNQEEKKFFLKLIDVKGLGCKMALPILASGSMWIRIIPLSNLSIQSRTLFQVGMN